MCVSVIPKLAHRNKRLSLSQVSRKHGPHHKIKSHDADTPAHYRTIIMSQERFALKFIIIRFFRVGA